MFKRSRSSSTASSATPCSSPPFSTRSASSAIPRAARDRRRAAHRLRHRAADRPRRCCGLFAVQHSVMARPVIQALVHALRARVRRAQHVRAVLEPGVDRVVRAAGSRSAACVWEISDPAWRGRDVCAVRLRLGLVLVSTFLINHFDLFGLRQVWLQLVGKPYTHLQFGTPGPYKLDPPSAVSRLVLRVLGDAGDDGDPPAVRARHDRRTS